MGRLLDKVAIVTGAAQGIGEGIARALAREGATGALWDVSERVHETAKAISRSGRKAFSYNVDVADADQTNQTVKEVSERFGKVDILVNNAGIAHFVPFVEMTADLRDKTFSVNFYGVWNCSKAAIPIMIEQKYGKIVNVSSVTGPHVATPGLTAYSATKGAISAFTRALALEVAEYGITVNAILPGFIDTPLTKPMADDFQMNEKEFSHWLGKSIPMKRMGTTEELGNLAVFLASDESTYITGQEIIIDGGNIIQEVKGIK
jgi:NAD(P)-dependent dehydrogenase (short-subunit alcohol dehydrogenase family)